MAGSTKTTRFCFWLWLIRVVGVIVPRRLRRDWRQEWEAELRYRETLLAEWDRLDWRHKVDLLWRSTSAFWDALWLQPRRLEDEMFQDLRYGVRMLLNRPAFSAVVILVLALGIGATSAIFSVVNGVLLRPLPYPSPDRLMMVLPVSEDGGRGGRIVTLTAPDFVEMRNQCSVCDGVAAHTGAWPGNLAGGVEPDRVRIARVTENLFNTIGVQPLLGRTFLPQEMGRPSPTNDMQAIGSTAVILSHSLWRQRFGGDPDVIGKAVQLEGSACSVVGVMPEGFNFPDEAEAWAPVALSPGRGNAYLRVVARLKTGAEPSQAKAELESITSGLRQDASQNGGPGLNLIPLQEHVVGNVRSSLLIFLGAVSFVLLIACANVANLLLARAATRQKEMAVRAALGASRLRIIRQLVTESLLLAFTGGGLGLLLAFGFLNLLVSFAPQGVPRVNDIRIDPWVLGFTVLLSVLTGMVFGLAPALQASRPKLNTTLKEGGARVTGGGPRHRLRSLLVMAEVSMALVLLIGAGLMLKSFTRLRETKLGFNPDHVLVASVTLPEATYPAAAQVKSYFQQAVARLASVPEAQAVAVVNSLPLGNPSVGIQGDLTVEGEAKERPGLMTSKLAVGGDYFRALGIPVLKGRSFNDLDTADSPGVVIISEALAQTLWPDEDALGKRINIGFARSKWSEVIGVVSDVKQWELGAPPAAATYHPLSQVADGRRWFVSEMTFVIRTAAEPQRFIAGLRSELQSMDRDLPLYNVAVMEQVVAKRVTDPRFYTLLLGSFSALALILAAAGIYSLISYSVTQRTHEIGIRLALGAQAGDVLRLVVRQGMTLVLAGLVVGVAGALMLTRVLSEFLYEVSVTDPATYGLLSGLLAVIAFLACYFPGRRATKVDPLVALRHE